MLMEPAHSRHREIVDMLVLLTGLPCYELQKYLPDNRDEDELLLLMQNSGYLTAYQSDQFALRKEKSLILGKYQILDRLGSGGMGEVYLARELNSRADERVAIKVLCNRLADDPVARVRLEREARSAARLRHPSIIRVLELHMEHTPPYLVMEFIPGMNLQNAVATHGTLSQENAAGCGLQIAQALQHAHENGLVHRDVKPANLLLEPSGRVKLLDLGIVRVDNEPMITQALCGRNRTDKVILGTIDYIAPEQARDSSEVDIRADIYALGATLYFLLAGHPPFPDGDLVDKLMAKQDQDPVPIHHLRPDISDAFSIVLARMLARSPANRYATPADVAYALKPWANSKPSLTQRQNKLLTPVNGQRTVCAVAAEAGKTLCVPQVVPFPVAASSPTSTE